MPTRWRIISLLLIATLFAALATTALPRSSAAGKDYLPQAQACGGELVVNGGFEDNSGWQLGVSPVPPQYVTYTFKSGLRSLQLGITSGANVESFSSTRQLVTIPPTATQAILSFWFYAQAEAPAGTDYMELALLSPDGLTVWAKPWRSHNDSRVWNLLQFDLSAWRGQSFQIYFNVYNDGLGGKAAMFLDDVSLSMCGPVVPDTPGPTATSTLTPPTPPVTPSSTPGCVQLARNGSFNDGLAFWEPDNPAGVGISTETFTTSPFSLQLGSLNINYNGLSTARQLISVPAGYPNVRLEAAVYTQSQTGAGADWQEIALLSTTGAVIGSPLPRVQLNDNAWRLYSFDVSYVAGQTVYLRFGVNNDGAGGRTAMYVDDVRLTACSSAPAPTPWPTPSWTAPAPTWTPWPTSWPTPWPTAWPTEPATPPLPPPSGCVDILQNGNFDAGLDAWTPGNNPLRPSAVSDPVWSAPLAAEMGTRIQNVNSYSSIRQTVNVPFGYDRTFISFWAYTWAESLADDDRQQFVILGPNNVVWATPWKVLESEEAWRQHVFELVGAPGSTFDVYFAAINDGVGGRTTLGVDNARVWVCTVGAMPALAEAPLLAAEAFPTPDPYVVPVESPAPFAAQETQVTVVPFETAPADARVILPPFTPMPEGAAQDVTELPAAEWTQVSIEVGGQSGAPQPTAMGTPLPPDSRSPQTPGANPDAMLTQAVEIVATVAPSQDRLPFGLFDRVTERWPEQWPWVVGLVLLGLVVIVVLVIWNNRQKKNQNPY